MVPTDERVRVADSVFLHVRRWPGGADDAGGGALSGKRPFLLVHGLSSNARLWDQTALALAEAGHAVHAVDLRSHGDSDAPPDGYDTATAAEDLAAIVGRHLGRTSGAAFDSVPRAVVAGQSWGGNVVLVLAAKHPETVAALALVDGGWLDPASEFASWEECERVLRPPDIDGLPANELRGYVRRAHPTWSPEAVEATLYNMRVWPDGTITRRLSIDRHMRIVRSMWDDPPQRYYASVSVPVLLIPAGDPARLSRVEAAAAALSDATIRPYSGADHDVHAQYPGKLATDLLALAARVGD
jgi:pimeloyl-ACP methyl ester carboxylesterase